VFLKLNKIHAGLFIRRSISVKIQKGKTMIKDRRGHFFKSHKLRDERKSIIVAIRKIMSKRVFNIFFSGSIIAFARKLIERSDVRIEFIIPIHPITHMEKGVDV